MFYRGQCVLGEVLLGRDETFRGQVQWGKGQLVGRRSFKRTLALPLFGILAMACLVSHHERLPHHRPKIIRAKLIHTRELKLLHFESKPILPVLCGHG